MNIMKLYELIKEYEVENHEVKFGNKGDLYIQSTDQFFRHFLDRISYKFIPGFIFFYSPKLGKTFKIPDSNLKNIELSDVSVPSTLMYPTYVFGYEPSFITNINDEYIWNDKELSFFLEKIR